MDARSPTSPSTQSMSIDFLRASSTINDLTRVLASFSRATTPDGTSHIVQTCCCGQDTCESAVAWADVRAQLEKRIVLSAEVGQALLERYEAYVRHQQAQGNKLEEAERRHRDTVNQLTAARQANDQLVSRLGELSRHNGQMDKRLAQCQLNLDVADSSNRSLLHEIAETRTALNKLQLQQSRFTGLEARLDSITQERNDLRDECGEAATRARAAESQVGGLERRCEELEVSLNMLQYEQSAAKMSRSETLREMVKDARDRLGTLQDSATLLAAKTNAVQFEESAACIETLVADNEALKRDNAELRNMLVEAREDVRLLRDEVEGRRSLNATPFLDRTMTAEEEMTKVGSPPRFHSTMNGSSHARKSSWGSTGGAVPYRTSNTYAPSFQSSAPLSPYPRAVSPVFAAFAQAQEARRASLIDRPLDSRAFMSPDLESHTSSEWQDRNSATGIRPPSRLSSEFDGAASDSALDADGEAEHPRAKKRQLMLLSRSRGVQTDPIPDEHAPTVASENTPVSGRSRTATADDLLPDQQTQLVPALISRVSALLTRLNQADVPTLTLRLKRQRLAGDIGHLSRSTIRGVANDIAQLRGHLQLTFDAATHPAVGQESILSRNDFRALVKLCKDLLAQVAQLREVVNEVTLDPASATKLRDQSNGTHAAHDDTRPAIQRPPSTAGWMAPLSKFFGQTGADAAGKESDGAAGRKRFPELAHPVPRLVPKLSAEVAASVTTVNVEFAGTGVIRRAVSTMPHAAPQLPPSPTPTFEQAPTPMAASASVVSSEGSLHQTIAQPRARKRSDDRRDNLRSIFAGSRIAQPTESWVVLPRSRPPTEHSATMRQREAKRMGEQVKRLSTHVDAVIDSPQTEGSSDFQTTLLERTLRRRGLSDSSMHSTFLSAPVNRLISPQSLSLATTSDSPDASPSMSVEPSSYSDKQQSMLQALGRRVYSLTAGVTGASPAMEPRAPIHDHMPPDVPSPAAAIPHIVVRKPTAPQPINISRSRVADNAQTFGSYREESILSRTLKRDQGRDFA